MAKPVLVVTRKLPDAVERAAQRSFETRLNPEDRLYDSAELLRLAQGADALLVAPGTKLDRATIGALPAGIKIVATFSVGTDHIDLAAAKERGLPVTNTPDVLTDATADIALLLLLGAARRASEGEKWMREASWTGWTPTQMLGIHVGGKRLGIIGMGRIGQAVADRARAFGMIIHYHNRKHLPPELEKGAVFHARAEELLTVSDFLSFHCPATPETHHFLNAARIALLPQGAVVVNTARGTVVEDDALIAALKSGRIAAAGLDVFENEPKVHPGYRTLPNTFLLPHLGSATLETRNAMGFRALDNLEAFFAGKNPPHRVA